MGKVLEKRDLRTLTDAGGISITRLKARVAGQLRPDQRPLG